MIFSALENHSAECRNYGNVHAAGSPDLSKCCATGKGVDTAAVREKSTAILQTLNFDSMPCEVSMNSISCELLSEIACTTARGSIERRGQSQYEISYQPTIKGRHQLHIKVEGQHIRGSPFPRSSVEKLSTPILTIGGVRGPEGVAVNQRREVVITEFGGHCVTVFSPTGERLQSFGSHGSAEGQFKNPFGVAVDGEENVLVADCWNHRIQKFTTQGKFFKAVGTEGSGPLQFNFPVGIAFSASNGRVYVVENGNDRIQILSAISVLLAMARDSFIIHGI